MGLSLKKIGKSLSKAAKAVTKSVSIKNITNAATGNYSAVLSDVKNHALGALKPQSKQPVNVVTNGGKVVQMSEDNAQAALDNGSAQSVSVPKAKSSGTSDGNGILDFLKTAAGGAAAALGVKVAGTDAGNAAINATASQFGWAWIKKNALYIGGGVAVLGTGLYFIFRGKRKKTRW